MSLDVPQKGLWNLHTLFHYLSFISCPCSHPSDQTVLCSRGLQVGLGVRFSVLPVGLLQRVSGLVRTPISLCYTVTIAVAMSRLVSSRDARCLCAARTLISPPPMYPPLGTKNCLVCCHFSGPSSGTTSFPFAGEGHGRNAGGKSFFCDLEALALPYQGRAANSR